MDVILSYPDNGDDSCKQFFLLATQIELDALPGIKVSCQNQCTTRWYTNNFLYADFNIAL